MKNHHSERAFKLVDGAICTVAHAALRALAEADVNIEAITTSEIKVSCLVARDQGLVALRAVHGEFELGVPPEQRVTFADSLAAARKAKEADAVAVVVQAERDKLAEVEEKLAAVEAALGKL